MYSSNVDRRNLAMKSFFKDSVIENAIYSVAFSNLRICVINQSVAPSKTLYALHHAVVALCVDTRDYEFAPQEVYIVK
jgi:hypothetical protein